MVQDEDTQPLETPIIAPIKAKNFVLIEKAMPDTTFDFRFLAGMMDHPRLARHVCLLGNLHCGKSSLMDIFVQHTHNKEWDHSKPTKYTDIRVDEQEREMSIKSVPMSLILPSLSGKSYLMNILDTPGHPNFSDEQTASLRLCDGAVIVVDAAEGVMAQTERSIKHAVEAGLPLTLVINKVDRLILELKLPPTDAYHKLCHTIQEVNEILEKCDVTGAKPQKMSPLLGNVCFAASAHGWIFSIQSFAKIYADYHGNFDAREFANRLWGSVYMHEDRSFHRKPEDSGNKRTFVHFLLEPLYKVKHAYGTL